MTEPVITIAIPCYNSARSIGRAVESGLQQRGMVSEVIVVDDGSTDGSCEAVLAMGDRVRLVRMEHRGANAARNRALALASGEWIQFLDADDYLLPGKIAGQLAAPAGADVIYSPVVIETESAEGVERTPSRIDMRRDLFSQWFAWELPQTGGALWRTDALRKLGGWMEGQPCCQEHELYARALRAGLRFQYHAEALSVYRMWSEETLCRRDPALTIRTRTELIRSMKRWLGEQGVLTPAQAEAAGQACFEMARTLARTSLRDATRYYEDRDREGLIHLSGPAAPPPYRIVRKVLGFHAAEKLAFFARGVKRPAAFQG